MAKIQFTYNEWDDRLDLLLDRPGTPLGYTAVNASIPIAHLNTKDADQRDALIGSTLDGVIGLLAGSLEWVRRFGLSAEEVQSKVRAYTATRTDSNKQQTLLATYKAIHEISDPANKLKNHRTDRVIPVA